METSIRQAPVAVLTTVYSQARDYLDTFLTSLEQQTDRRFDLVLVNDGLDDLDKLKEVHEGLVYRTVEHGSTPVENRERGIRFCVQAGYDSVIFADADDYFEPVRVAVLTAKLHAASVDCVINDIHIVDQHARLLDRSYFSNRYRNNQSVSLQDIRHSNVFGLSNTAVRTSCLSRLSIAPEVIALDWYLFTVLLMRGCRAVFTNEANTYYRQHDTNTAGLGQATPERVRNAIRIKCSHYHALRNVSEDFSQLFRYFADLSARVRDEAFFRSYYSNCMDVLSTHPLWWEDAVCLRCGDEH